MFNQASRKITKIVAWLLLIAGLLALAWWHGQQDIASATPSGSQFQLTPLSPGFSDATTTADGAGTDRGASTAAAMPIPDNFPHFDYDPAVPYGTSTLSLYIRCQDAYYAILIFNTKDDYRDNPSAAQFNQATACRQGEDIKRILDLRTLNLTAGRYYYLIADQGQTGSWHDVR